MGPRPQWQTGRYFFRNASSPWAVGRYVLPLWPQMAVGDVPTILTCGVSVSGAWLFWDWEGRI